MDTLALGRSYHLLMVRLEIGARFIHAQAETSKVACLPRTQGVYCIRLDFVVA